MAARKKATSATPRKKTTAGTSRKKTTKTTPKAVVTNVSSDGPSDAVVIVTEPDGTEHQRRVPMEKAPDVGEHVKMTGKDEEV